MPIDFCKFISEVNDAESTQDAFNVLAFHLNQLGFDRVVYSLINDNQLLQQKRGHGILRNYPEDWMKYYNSKNYIEVDPVIKLIKQKTGAFHWSDIPNMSNKQLTLMYEAKSATLFDGIGVSIHETGGRIIGMGTASSAGKIDKNDLILSLVQAMCNHFHQFYYKNNQKRLSETIKLSPRELSVLSFLAEGKTRGEISDILLISEDTTKIYIKRIFEKMSVNSIMLAVTKGILFGLICPNIPHNYKPIDKNVTQVGDITKI